MASAAVVVHRLLTLIWVGAVITGLAVTFNDFVDAVGTITFWSLVLQIIFFLGTIFRTPQRPRNPAWWTAVVWGLWPIHALLWGVFVVVLAIIVVDDGKLLEDHVDGDTSLGDVSAANTLIHTVPLFALYALWASDPVRPTWLDEGRAYARRHPSLYHTWNMLAFGIIPLLWLIFYNPASVYETVDLSQGALVGIFAATGLLLNAAALALARLWPWQAISLKTPEV